MFLTSLDSAMLATHPRTSSRPPPPIGTYQLLASPILAIFQPSLNNPKRTDHSSQFPPQFMRDSSNYFYD